MARLVFALMLICSGYLGLSQEAKVQVGGIVELANGLHWWRYNRGQGQGWDRTDNLRIPKASIGVFAEKKHWRLTLLYHYEWINEKKLERFEDRPQSRILSDITEGILQIQSAELSVLHYLILKDKFQFGLGLGAGTFFIQTDLPEQEDFGAKWLWSMQVINQFHLSEHWRLMLGLFYDEKIIRPNQAVPERRHDLFTFGIKSGLIFHL